MAKQYNKYIKFFIPKLAFDNLHYKLSVNPPKTPKYCIESFYGILNDLSNIRYYDSFEKKNEMTPLHSKLLKRKYGNDYDEYIAYLKNNSIIYGGTFYKPNQCYYYGIVLNDTIVDLLENEGYITSTYCFQIYESDDIQVIDINRVKKGKKKVKDLDVVSIKVSTKTKIGKYIKTEHNKDADTAKHFKPHIRKMERHFKSTISINYDAAMTFVQQQYQTDIANAKEDVALINKIYNKYIHRVRSIIEINEGKSNLRFGRNPTNNRIDTNLTNMASELRQFLGGFENMAYLDLSNSQPVLFNVMLDRHSAKRNPSLEAEKAKYKHYTLSGNWYELLMSIYKTDDRNIAKEVWMIIAYSENKTKLYKKRFAKHFPEIMKIIEYKKKDDHAAFSIELQRIESKIFIDEICKELVEANILPYTLHDGIIVGKEKEKETYAIMTNVLKNHLGSIPVISINGIKKNGDLETTKQV